MYKRPYFKTLLERLKEPRKFIQVLAGPRQTGKTTLILQVLDEIGIPSHYASADGQPNRSSVWIEQQWQVARLKMEKNKDFILTLDEVQKIKDWTETVKKCWDEDTRRGIAIKTVLLGSSPLLIKKGVAESLGGRFEMLRLSHWPLAEMKAAFNISLEEFIYFGGYPGAVSLIPDENRWKNYVKDSLIETTISKDILLMTRIDKPALLRELFTVGSLYSGQILSYNKMLGQLQDAGNTTTLAHYLQLLSSASMLTGIQKYFEKKLKRGASSPKFQVLNNAFLTAPSPRSFAGSRLHPEYWGRLTESAVGVYLTNAAKEKGFEVFYWRGKNLEVDFVLKKGEKLVAVEVKSGSRKEKLPGLDFFSKKFNNTKVLLVGQEGFSIEDFLRVDLDHIF
ncbi:MAG: ATP-binding protein [Candidatus Aminicenantes bacterium]|nr:ATP-binding protein [Candidatus Aminicenantes bacterium]